jgi:hypothetical protein
LQVKPLISRNAKKDPIIDNLGWVNHIAMTPVATGTGMERDIRYTLQMKIKRASLLAKIIVMIHGATEIGTERDMKHT